MRSGYNTLAADRLADAATHASIHATSIIPLRVGDLDAKGKVSAPTASAQCLAIAATE